MTLSATQRGFLDAIGVKPRPKKAFHMRSKEEVANDKILSVTDDYIKREAKVIEAVGKVGETPGTGHLVAELEQRVAAIQSRVKNASRDEAQSVIKTAYDDLDAVRDQAAALSKSAGRNTAFYADLDRTTKAVATLEGHPHQASATVQIGAAKTSLTTARNQAKEGKFADAAISLAAATQSATAGKATADQIAPLFARAAQAKLDSEALKKHSYKDKLVNETFAVDAALRKFDGEAAAGNVAGATLAVTQAETACRDGKQRAADFTAFYPAVAKTKAALDALKLNIRKADIKTQTDAASTDVQTAEAEAAAGKISEAKAALGRADAACALGKLLAPLALRLALLKPKLEELRKHPQRAHIADELTSADTNVALAQSKLTAGDAAAATVALEAAERACTSGKDFAEKFAEVVKVKAETMRSLGAFRGIAGAEPWFIGNEAAFATAAALAEPPARNYGRAKSGLQLVLTTMNDTAKRWYVDTAPADLQPALDQQARLVGKPGAGLIDTDIANIRATQATIASDITAGKWAQAITTANISVPGAVTTAVKVGVRRTAYDQQRQATMAAIEGLKSHKSLLGQIASMQTLVAKADALATRTAMRFEDGVAELKKIDATCAQLGPVATDAAAYLAERTTADNELAALRGGKAREALAPQLKSIEALLGQARDATGVIDAAKTLRAGPTADDLTAHAQDWGQALQTVRQARAEIKAADQLAGQVEGTLATKNAAAGAGDVTAAGKAEEALRQQATEAQRQPNADAAAKEYLDLFAALDDAKKQAGEGKLDPAKAQLGKAADLLIAAKTVQAERARFAAAFKLLDNRRVALEALTDPPAAQLGGLLPPIKAALAAATAGDTARDWGKAQAGLRTGEAAANEAETIRDLRKTFNADAATLESKLTTIADPLKGEITSMIAKARGEADQFDLNYARRYLENAEAQLASDTVKSLATANPDDPKFLAAIQKMLSARGGSELTVKPAYVRKAPKEVDPLKASQAQQIPGGAELLDKLVAELATGGNAAANAKTTKAIAIIAKERFGLDLSVSRMTLEGGKAVEKAPDTGATFGAAEQAGHEQLTKRAASAKKIYEMLSRVPEQAEGNPSMRRFERRDAREVDARGDLTGGEASGGFYQAEKDLVVMSGRAGDMSKQKFGASLNALSASIFGVGVSQLPALSDPVYAPANEDEIDYFDFASVHEVGHAVDDRMNFMKSREGNAAFGGWTVYGGAIQPIIDAVTEDVVGKNNGADKNAVKQYVADVLAGANPDKPAVGADEQAATDQACADADAWYAIATNEKVWWNQSDTGKITLGGTVYQEAYKGTWVSYPAAERAKGITGYQFRAPGEWFAELYAAYHMGKLKNGHPARRWLSSLSL